MGGLTQYVWVVGAVIVLAVTIQAVWMAWDLARRLEHQNAQRRRLAGLLDARLEAARARRDADRERSLLWTGWRKFVVTRTATENPQGDVRSFHLAPHDGKPIPSFQPGQFLTFQLRIPGQPRPVVRCYSLSDAPRPDGYRVTIKRIGAPPGGGAPAGLASSYFHDEVREGHILDVRAPAGSFVLDKAGRSPVVLIGGGVGITPLLSMLNALVAAGDERTAWLFYGVRHGGEHIMKEHLARVARERPGIRLVACYSQPAGGDVEGRDYQVAGRVGLELLKRLLPSNNFEFFVCGPSSMMDSMVRDLGEWGVPQRSIHFERFGPGAPKRPEARPAGEGAGPGFEVLFSRSGRKTAWSPGSGTLLDLARANGIAIDSGCERGDCGTCVTALRAGGVEYPEPPTFPSPEGTCLVCCSVPRSSVELDA